MTGNVTPIAGHRVSGASASNVPIIDTYNDLRKRIIQIDEEDIILITSDWVTKNN